MTDQTPEHDDRLFFDAMRDQIQATPMPPPRRTWTPRRLLASPNRPARRFGLLSGAGIIVAGMIAVAVLMLSATASTPPAYALTRNPDGSLTITLSNLTTGIPALNAKFAQLGIPETVIPIKQGCHSPDGSGNMTLHPDPTSEYNGSVSFTYTRKGMRPPPRGFRYVLAAKRLSNGKILGFIGALKPPIPSCLPYDSTPES